ncbi:MAG: bifunctional diaminohydroxyphosphoribosylaminopyrimidine deaminase/5-amino-6-(5-phosphoribosylamino)uracil reductase RibD [Gammaproteobacteria bacterium]|uniref:bifunctional diaminohydroxyphosphoribosylaminopyrimidine deaminase/5-amino-6-(5-phosphoribosylamino)uracil reductase RibD n=1 Tax=Methylotuvimicrobium sp. TaxID=2822413 RepID=UPI001DBBF8BA|nr:bifunctional diaminohydroxyphosphoribosylaminopyrimidine deaminase/5-amino-6-(5-phosphoribosylamino)uracil reductase RibD [Gammaproteobacteria bacterium]
MTSVWHPDEFYMARAIQLAHNGLYTTQPNPRVGCVLVKEGSIIAEGWHARAGEGHAEVEALKRAQSPEGATVYVTLEPCSHHGRTPPCCEALIKAGVVRVVAAMQDPNPLVSGRGLTRLNDVGIDVRCGVLQNEAMKLNPGFIKRMQTGLPFVRGKLAMSLDGRTAMASGESKWITSDQSRADVHRYRARSSAILTGINTVLADDPALNARVEFETLQPARVVLDTRLRMPPTARLLTLPGRNVVVTCSQDRSKIDALQQLGAEVYCVAERSGKVDLSAVMDLLGRLQFNEIFIEAGPTLSGALLAENLVDEWLIYMSTNVLGDEGRGLFRLPGLEKMAHKKHLSLCDIRQIGPDLRLTLKPA